MPSGGGRSPRSARLAGPSGRGPAMNDSLIVAGGLSHLPIRYEFG
ncbi:hypothetical protein [Frankia sp. CcI49]|nr:hypothetical protein [Frankia sp. CcI49]